MLPILLKIVCDDKDDDLYHSDSDESVHLFPIFEPPRRLSTLSLNTIDCRRRSNPDIYPGARRYSTSYSQEDILSNDQLEQIHFDPRYRDYRSASSLYNRTRSNSLNSVGSGGNIINQYQQFRRLSNQSPSPPLLGAPLMPQKRWDTNPSIFIEEYYDDNPSCNSKIKSKSESRSSILKSAGNSKGSKDTLGSSSDSLLPLNECDIKSFGDLSNIPFIDDDSNDSAADNTNRFANTRSDNEISGFTQSTSFQQPSTKSANSNCRKTVSFDVIAGQSSSKQQQQPKIFSTDYGNNFPQIPKSNPYPTDSVIPPSRTNVRTTRDGINRYPYYYQSSYRKSSSRVPNSSSCDDHCTLFEKLIRLKMEEERENLHRDCCRRGLAGRSCDGKNEPIQFCEGKVKALTTYFNTLPYLSDNCKCVQAYQSTPDLSTATCRSDKLSDNEMEMVRRQLKEWSEFGLKSSDKPESGRLTCDFFTTDHYKNNVQRDCRTRIEKMCRSLEDLAEPCPLICHHCCVNVHKCCRLPSPKQILSVPPPRADRHNCRSACYRKSKKLRRSFDFSFADDNNESLVI